MSDINDNIDKIQEDVTDIKIVMTRNTSSLEEHMKRTSIAEQRIELLQEKLSTEIAPIKSHVAMVNTTIKVIAGIGALLIFLNELGIIKAFFSKL